MRQRQDCVRRLGGGRAMSVIGAYGAGYGESYGANGQGWGWTSPLCLHKQSPERGSNMFLGLLNGAFLLSNTIFWCLLIYPLILGKILAPSASRSWWTRKMVILAEAWVACNSWGLFLLKPLRWEVQGVEGLNPGESYLVIANHQSWVDILFLQKVLYRQVPFLRFFLKKELAYVPFLGLAWWALDYPFMNRYSNEYLQKHPEKRGQDLEITRQACERFRGQPIAILNFLEGTRWTPEKWQKARSTFRNLLPPKRGGVAFVLQAMGDQFAALLDVSIFYPQGVLTVWDLLCGRMDHVVIRLRKIPIPKQLVGAQNLERKENRSELKSWVQEIWEDKDHWIDGQKQKFRSEGMKC